ncbi:hypothetical protein KN63_08670 [Smithella sp. F21]|nr:hypothetical protein KN63_08670 [Smithella sp. F21]
MIRASDVVNCQSIFLALLFQFFPMQPVGSEWLFPKRCALRERPAEPSLIIPSRADSRSGTIGWSRSPSQGSAQPGVISGIRRLRHCPFGTLSSVSAMFNKLPCFGVYRNGNYRRAISSCEDEGVFVIVDALVKNQNLLNLHL